MVKTNVPNDLLADGRVMSASVASAMMKRDFYGVRKHLRVTRAAGVLDREAR